MVRSVTDSEGKPAKSNGSTLGFFFAFKRGFEGTALADLAGFVFTLAFFVDFLFPGDTNALTRWKHVLL